jgi:Holliday junction resolvase-like predicted endonuclease
MTIVARNLELSDGELDILARDGIQDVVVEVRCIQVDSGDPIDAISESKRRHVSRLASRIGATRVDHLGIRFDANAISVHWLPG